MVGFEIIGVQRQGQVPVLQCQVIVLLVGLGITAPELRVNRPGIQLDGLCVIRDGLVILPQRKIGVSAAGVDFGGGIFASQERVQVGNGRGILTGLRQQLAARIKVIRISRGLFERKTPIGKRLVGLSCG